MSDAASLTDDANWSGFYYELAIRLGPRDDERLERALRAVWADERLTGPYAQRGVDAADQVVVDPSAAELVPLGMLYGVARLPEGASVVCETWVVRGDDGTDWVDLSLPTGALARVDRRVEARPGGDDPLSLDWRRPIDDWLASVARRVFEVTGFEYALVGAEVGGEDAPDGDPPAERYVGCLLPRDGRLEYLPATR